MTTNQTIDDVPRGLLENFASYAEGSASGEVQLWAKKLRALLDANPEKQFNPQGWSIDHSAGRPILMHNNCSVIEAEQAYGLLELIKSAAQPQGEPVARLGVHHVLGAIHNVPGFPGVKGNHIHDLTTLLNGVLASAEQPAPVAAEVVLPDA
ncbi:hypothetical protein HOT57_gp58 [Pseudomonas phage phCDa]|uniref:Uncharacterized protein n=1 Tax=Pseudomonas phage phCDa TaxID=2268587 RepID=A0A2Z5HAG6_9CAUD|nr:hypothetical protein HOT57_gp58 [Pseudomonas phage phCDa]AXC36502.1 hypothetical protein phCDa_58 [Pseudomonas phage phCDa]